MNDNPCISIVMPVYNASTYLREALESVLQQTFSDFELIVVDDGSTDNSRDILQTYCDPRMRLISNTHDFISSLNKGVHASTGRYIARMDADDMMTPERLEIQFGYMEDHPDIDICGSYAESFGEMIRVIQRPLEHVDIVSMMIRMNPMMHPTVMMRISILRQSGFLYKYGYHCAEDYKLWTELALRGFKFANIPEPLLHYRISPQQVTRVSQNEMLVSTIKIGLEYAEAVIEQMIEKEEMYGDLFNSLIESLNNDLIIPDVFLQMIYPVYRDFLLSKIIK